MLLDLTMIAEPLELTEEAAAKNVDNTEVQKLCLNKKRRLRRRIGGLIEVQVDEVAGDGVLDQYLNNPQHYHSLGTALYKSYIKQPRIF